MKFLQYFNIFFLLFFITTADLTAAADDFIPHGYFRVSNVEPGRTRLYWDTSSGKDLSGYISIYGTTNTLTSSAAVSNSSDAALNMDTKPRTFLLASGLHPGLRQWDHVLGNYPETTFGENITREISYYLLAKTFKAVEKIVYDDTVKGYIHEGSELSESEISSGGYASASCLSNYFAGKKIGWKATSFVFFNAATSDIDLTPYSDGAVAFYVKEETGSLTNAYVVINSSAVGEKRAFGTFADYCDVSRLKKGKWTYVQVPFANFGELDTTTNFSSNALNIYTEQQVVTNINIDEDSYYLTKDIVTNEINAYFYNEAVYTWQDIIESSNTTNYHTNIYTNIYFCQHPTAPTGETNTNVYTDWVDKYEFRYPNSNVAASNAFTALGSLHSNGVFISNYNLTVTNDTKNA
ncbi:MAG TPA: hypothetical protein VKS21_04190, partial [Spirochaetota bacterium]|nr:hypothetical protein [Spirochaetota bacterium]